MKLLETDFRPDQAIDWGLTIASRREGGTRRGGQLPVAFVVGWVGCDLAARHKALESGDLIDSEWDCLVT